MQEFICKNCKNHFVGNYCNNCGEKIHNENDKRISILFADVFHFVTHFEGTLLTSLKTIILHPGKFSEDYCNGVRKKYFKPLSLFLMLIILYLLFPVFEGLNMRLFYHTTHEMYGSFAQKKVSALMAAKNMDWAQVSETFHAKGEKVSKFLLFIILPVMATLSWLLAFKKRKYYYDHFIYVTENTSFLLLWGFLVLPIIMLFLRIIFGTNFLLGDKITGPVILTGMLLFSFISVKRFFKFSIWYCIIYSIIYLGLLVLFIQNIYKFILFYLTITQL